MRPAESSLLMPGEVLVLVVMLVMPRRPVGGRRGRGTVKVGAAEAAGLQGEDKLGENSICLKKYVLLSLFLYYFR